MDLQRLKQLAGTSLGEAISRNEINSAQNDIDFDQGSQMEEDADQLNELSQKTLASYTDKAFDQRDHAKGPKPTVPPSVAKKREAGLDRAYSDSRLGSVEEAYDLNNGYYDRQAMDGQDYFPNGADGPVTDKVGPSGARQGDNPEQKKMEVAETHKELVYNYRRFLKESNENHEKS